jgi:hypothetical protein
MLDDYSVLAVSTDVQPSSSEAGGGKGSETTVVDVPSATPSSSTVTFLAGPGVTSVVGMG